MAVPVDQQGYVETAHELFALADEHEVDREVPLDLLDGKKGVKECDQPPFVVGASAVEHRFEGWPLCNHTCVGVNIPAAAHDVGIEVAVDRQRFWRAGVVVGPYRREVRRLGDFSLLTTERLKIGEEQLGALPHAVVLAANARLHHECLDAL